MRDEIAESPLFANIAKTADAFSTAHDQGGCPFRELCEGRPPFAFSCLHFHSDNVQKPPVFRAFF
ncbi:MAG: hypothetical protein IJM27_10715 [Eubacterium sp.]|nr:hypothetical protein [Eubacterium sp.]